MVREDIEFIITSPHHLQWKLLVEYQELTVYLSLFLCQEFSNKISFHMKV